MSEIRAIDLSSEKRYLGAAGQRVFRSAGVIGLLGLASALLLAFSISGNVHRFFHAYLVNFAYFLSLGLGALFFVLLQHLTRSGWSVVVRRLAEGMAGSLPILAILSLPVLAGMPALYRWSNAEALAQDPLLQGKRPYLNPTFFVVRVAVYFAVWTALTEFFYRTSLRQDATKDPALTLRMQKFSAPAMVLFAITLTFASFDLVMSVDPHWYSTIFGVYYFSGAVVGFFALLVLVTFLLQRSGRLRHVITAEHYHDLGKLVFAFTVFWAYIAFSQYMLIWYANLPEETVWYRQRQTGGWTAVSLALLFGHFGVPFLALISRHPKRRRRLLVAAAVWVLVLHWVDIYWLVVPSLSPDRVTLGLMEVTCFVGIGGLVGAGVVHRLRDRSLVPEGDPRLEESLTFENV